ncbi:helix-turn-helix transcriptional regulator [Kitasatospora sp. RB6PN24]|uniref:helix-turn-helix domain-containing protein n=1 Tax=Kitasatospora humi TaxID=2893891 RepID=UPI001E2DDC94|nr:helix-turn-helix transcriptional regulator [Kitasatospora humi]MCC9312230.1 helix-turn-helix transcriptional regulator [Kitasatospora humi]
MLDERAIAGEIAQDMEEALRGLRRTLADSPSPSGGHPPALTVVVQLQAQLEALTAGLVGLERRHRTTWSRIAAMLGAGEDGVRHRYRPEYIARRLSQFARTARPDNDAPRPPHLLVHGGPPKQYPPSRLSILDATANPELPPAAARPAYNRLSSMLSMLVRGTNRTQTDLAQRSGCSPSYLSRILSGHKVPTWHLTEALALACGADPTLLYDTWMNERLREFGGPHRPTATPADLTREDAQRMLAAALATLHVRAGSPTAYDIAVASKWRLSPDRITDMIRDTDLTNFRELAILIGILGGEQDYFHQLWKAANGNTTLPPPPPSTPQQDADPSASHQAQQIASRCPTPHREGVAARVRRLRKQAAQESDCDPTVVTAQTA